MVFGVATTVALSGFALQHLLPGRRIAFAGVTRSSTVAGAALGVVGFFMISVVGGFLGFVLGIYPAERIRLGTHAGAWPSTNHALNAIRLSMGIELLTALAIVTTWLIGVTTPPECVTARRLDVDPNGPQDDARRSVWWRWISCFCAACRRDLPAGAWAPTRPRRPHPA